MVEQDELYKILLERSDLPIILERIKMRAKKAFEERPNFYILPENVHFDFLEDNWESKYLDKNENLLPNFHEIVLIEGLIQNPNLA